GTAPGAVVASPSKADPNYFYHWVRDAAISMYMVVLFYERAQTPQEKTYFATLLANYTAFEHRLQSLPNPTNNYGWPVHLGEPKYNVDGSIDSEPWGRPQ